MAWTKEWTIDSVAGNYKALGMVDPEDIEQLIADSRELLKAKKLLADLEARAVDVYYAWEDCLMSKAQEKRLQKMKDALVALEDLE